MLLGLERGSLKRELRLHEAIRGTLTYLVAQTVKCLSTLWETWVLSLGREVPWRRKWQPTPVILPRKSHGRRSLVSMGLQRVGHDWATSLSFLIQYGCCLYKKKLGHKCTWRKAHVKAQREGCSCLVAESCPTLCDPMDYIPPGSSMGFPRQEYWSGLPFPSPRDLPDPGIEPGSLSLSGRVFSGGSAEREGSYLQTKGHLRGNQHCWLLDLRFLASRIMRK